MDGVSAVKTQKKKQKKKGASERSCCRRRHALEPPLRFTHAIPLPSVAAAAADVQNVEQQQQDAAAKKRKLTSSGAAAAGSDGNARPAAAPVAQQPPATSDDGDERDNQPAAKKQKGDGSGAGEIERQTVVSGIMSSQTFDQLDLTEQTKKAIAEMGFAHMTEVQARTIPQLLVGRDVLGAAKTGVRVEALGIQISRARAMNSL